MTRLRLTLVHSLDGWRVRVRWSNGRIFATTEAYSSHAKALEAAREAADAMSAGLPNELFDGREEAS